MLADPELRRPVQETFAWLTGRLTGLVPRVGYSTASAAPAARIATRQRKKIECLLVLASAADSVVKWV